MNRSHFRSRVAALGAILISAPAAAQTVVGGTGGILWLPGKNALQQANASSLVTTCVGLGNAGISPTSGGVSGDLKGRCDDLIANANELQAQSGVGVGATLGMSVAENNEALTLIQTTQTSAQGLQSLEATYQGLDAVGGRMFELRSGATGVSMKGFGDAVRTAFHGPFTREDDRWLASLWDDVAAGEPADDGSGGRLGVFVNGLVNFGDNDATEFQAGYDYLAYGLTAGVDWRLTEGIVAGMAFNWRNDETDYDDASKGSLGSLDDVALGGALYLTIFQDGFYADLIGSYMSHAYDLRRNIRYGNAGNIVNRTASSTPDANEWSWAFGTGWDFDLPWVEGMTLGPLFGAQWARLEVEEYTESGGGGLSLNVREQTVKSFVTTLGGKWAYAISTPIGVLVPQLRASWQHEFQNDPRQIKVSFVGDPFGTPQPIITSNPNRDWANVGATLSVMLPFNLSAFGDYEGLFGQDRYSSHQFTLGIRGQFL